MAGISIIYGFIIFIIGALVPIIIFFLLYLGARAAPAISNAYRSAFCSNLANGA
jgi:VIT1/CCC1 family predicted Fe2+/Mn2+ transporter